MGNSENIGKHTKRVGLIIILQLILSTRAMSLSTDIAPQNQTMPPDTPLLVYGCTPWRLSSQRVADLYNSGAKLWTKSDLTDIERQLEQSETLDWFVIRCVDGSQVHIKNPIQGARTPIW